MAIQTDILIKKVPLDGSDLQTAVRQHCADQAARDKPRRLVSTFVLTTTLPHSNTMQMELFLVFELFNQTTPA